MQHIDSQESWQAIAPLSQMVTRFAKLLWQSLLVLYLFSLKYTYATISMHEIC